MTVSGHRDAGGEAFLFRPLTGEIQDVMNIEREKT